MDIKTHKIHKILNPTKINIMGKLFLLLYAATTPQVFEDVSPLTWHSRWYLQYTTVFSR